MFTRYDKSWRPYRYRCPEARGGPYRMRVLAAPTILIEGDVGAYNTICIGADCRVLFLQAYGAWFLVS